MALIACRMDQTVATDGMVIRKAVILVVIQAAVVLAAIIILKIGPMQDLKAKGVTDAKTTKLIVTSVHQWVALGVLEIAWVADGVGQKEVTLGMKIHKIVILEVIQAMVLLKARIILTMRQMFSLKAVVAALVLTEVAKAEKLLPLGVIPLRIFKKSSLLKRVKQINSEDTVEKVTKTALWEMTITNQLDEAMLV